VSVVVRRRSDDEVIIPAGDTGNVDRCVWECPDEISDRRPLLEVMPIWAARR